MSKQTNIIIAVILIILAIAGFYFFYISGQKNTSSNEESQQVSMTDLTAVDVSIQNSGYSPSTLKIKKGTIVTFTNKDSIAHTVTSKSGNILNSGTLNQNETYKFKFDEAGTYDYYCTFHSFMNGTVIAE